MLKIRLTALTVFLVVAAVGCGSDNNSSAPVAQAQMNTAFYGDWISDCHASPDGGYSETSRITVNSDGTLTTIDRVYGTDDCTGAPTESRTSMRYTVLSNQANELRLRLTDIVIDPPMDEYGQTTELTTRVTLTGANRAEMKVVGAIFRDETGATHVQGEAETASIPLVRLSRVE